MGPHSGCHVRARLLAQNPLPDLVMIQEVDNDLQCDGSDKENHGRLASDGQHLSIAGHAKQAALEWKILGFGS